MIGVTAQGIPRRKERYACDDLFFEISDRAVGDILQCPVLERNLDTGCAAEFGERLLSALFDELVVVLPGVVPVLLGHTPELERDRLREAVVDIVEGVVIRYEAASASRARGRRNRRRLG